MEDKIKKIIADITEVSEEFTNCDEGQWAEEIENYYFNVFSLDAAKDHLENLI